MRGQEWRLQAARVAPECGTTRGYRRHLRFREETCSACRRAWSEYLAEWRRNAA